MTADTTTTFSPASKNEKLGDSPITIEYTVECQRSAFPISVMDFVLMAAHGHILHGEYVAFDHDNLLRHQSLSVRRDADLMNVQLVFDHGFGPHRIELTCDPNCEFRPNRVVYYAGEKISSETEIEYAGESGDDPVQRIQTTQFNFITGEPRTIYHCTTQRVHNADELSKDEFVVSPTAGAWCIECDTNRVFQFQPQIPPLYKTYTFWASCIVVTTALALMIRRRKLSIPQ